MLQSPALEVFFKRCSRAAHVPKLVDNSLLPAENNLHIFHD
jgi:hypothetical protein